MAGWRHAYICTLIWSYLPACLLTCLLTCLHWCPKVFFCTSMLIRERLMNAFFLNPCVQMAETTIPTAARTCWAMSEMEVWALEDHSVTFILFSFSLHLCKTLKIAVNLSEVASLFVTMLKSSEMNLDLPTKRCHGWVLIGGGVKSCLSCSRALSSLQIWWFWRQMLEFGPSLQTPDSLLRPKASV